MSFKPSKRARRRRGTDGISSIEFALVALPFFLLILGTFDIARYLLTLNSVTSLANAVGRYCLTNPILVLPSLTSLYASSPGVADAAPFLDQTVVQLTGTCRPQGGVFGTPVVLGFTGFEQAKVTVQYPFSPMTPGLDLLNMTISQTVTIDY